jgi:hypothetical protein
MKKFLRILLWSLLTIILAVVVGSTISYNTYWAKDVSTSVDPSNLAFYHENYNDCRAAFLSEAEKVKTEFDSVQTGKFAVPGKADQDLSLDWCYVPAQKEKNKLLIINAGLHGIEGYTGSAIQAMFMEKILKQELPDDMGVLFLHALNPYGFKYHRKATENNVDLNRNCVRGETMFNIENNGYTELTDFLQPAKPVNVNSPANRLFHFTAIWKIIRKSMPVLRQAALQGQYDHEGGIYYGGQKYEPQIEALQPFLTGMISQYKMLLNVDLHTGYGERAKMHLFIDKPEDKAVEDAVLKIFDGQQIDWGGTKDFYTVKGEYVVWANSLVPNVLCVPMVFEFGTLNSQTTFGSLKSIQVMILENEGAHYGYKNEASEKKAKKLFDELYFPESPAWRSKVMDDSYATLSKMVTSYESFKPAVQ